MPPKKTSDNGGSTINGRQPSQKEAFFFLEILANSRGNPDVDWDTVAERCGYSNAVCAKTRFGQIKKALGWTPASPGLSVDSPIAGRKKTTTPKTGTPTKKGKAKKKPTENEDEAEADIDDSKEAQVKQTPKRKRVKLEPAFSDDDSEGAAMWDATMAQVEATAESDDDEEIDGDVAKQAAAKDDEEGEEDGDDEKHAVRPGPAGTPCARYYDPIYNDAE